MAKRDPVIRAMAAQEINQENLLSYPNVVGVGTGYRVKDGVYTDEVCVQILVSHKVEPMSLAAHEMVPSALVGAEGDEVATDVLQIGPLHAQQDTGRYRPVPAGISIGAESRANAGTLGGYACDETDDTIVLLTNNHVISNLDTMPALRRIVQPGRFDGGVLPGDVIGQLKRDVTVNTVPNTPGAIPPLSVVDAAIGTIDVDFTYDLRQLNIPVIWEILAPAMGMDVQKRGRTTLLTTNGRITLLNATLDIGYRNGTRLGRVQNCFIISSTDGNIFSDSGDSGSVILAQEEGEASGTLPVVGLLFAGGSDQFGNPITIANDINAVFGALNLSTACNCVAKALVRAVFGAEGIRSEGYTRFLYYKERQLRRFRARMTSRRPFGKALERQIRKDVAAVGQILAEDEEAFGLLVEALRPLVRQPTNYGILRTEVDGELAGALEKFGSYVARRSKKLAPTVRVGKEILKSIEGRSIGDVLRADDLSFKPKKRPPKEEKSEG